jgi:hypothetical protein
MRHTNLMKWARYTYNISLGKSEGKRPLGVVSRKWGYSSKLMLKKLKRTSLAQLLVLQPRD